MQGGIHVSLPRTEKNEKSLDRTGKLRGRLFLQNWDFTGSSGTLIFEGSLFGHSSVRKLDARFLALTWQHIPAPSPMHVHILLGYLWLLLLVQIIKSQSLIYLLYKATKEF
jgi:hypothetical protein